MFNDRSVWEARRHCCRFQQLRRSCDEAAGPDGSSNRNVEGREAAKPLRETNLVGEGIRDAVLFLVATSYDSKMRRGLGRRVVSVYHLL